MMDALATRSPSYPSIARRTRSLGRAPVSPMVLEGLLELLTQLNEKVTALECRPQHQIIEQPTTFMPASVERLGYPEPEPERLPASAPARKVKVRRAKLWKMFD